MNEFPFCDALLPKKQVVLRLPLKDFCIGHELLLQRERNPLALLAPEDFVQLPDNEQTAAILRAVMICARSWKENFQEAEGVKKWQRMVSANDWAVAPGLFRAYRATASTFPAAPDAVVDRMLNDAGNGRFFGAEILPALVNFLSVRVGALDFETVYDMPYGMGLHLYYTELEFLGLRKIENAEERETREIRDEALAEGRKRMEAREKKGDKNA